MREKNLSNRREFLQAVAASGGFFSLGGLCPSVLASPTLLNNITDDRVLVVLQMSGGNDALNTLIPFDNDDYHRARPTLRAAKNKCQKIADGLGFAESMSAMKALFQEGSLAVVQGVGYPNANRSHFKSMDIWHSADASDRQKKSGWLGRYADLLLQQKVDSGIGINISAQPPLALQGERYRPLSFKNPKAFQFQGTKTQMRAFEKINEQQAAQDDSETILELLGKTAAKARQSSDEIRKATAAYKTPIEYDRSPLGGSLRTVAALLNAGLPEKVYYIYHNGFDTHVNQIRNHGRLLGSLSASLQAFQQDLKRLGQDRKVTTLVFSEFGRRVKENGSRGTDHGKAGVSMVMGTAVKGGLYGEYPSLTDLDQGDMKFNVDFRQIYASLLGQWLGADSKAILGRAFSPLPLFGMR